MPKEDRAAKKVKKGDDDNGDGDFLPDLVVDVDETQSKSGSAAMGDDGSKTKGKGKKRALSPSEKKSVSTSEGGTAAKPKKAKKTTGEEEKRAEEGGREEGQPGTSGTSRGPGKKLIRLTDTELGMYFWDRLKQEELQKKAEERKIRERERELLWVKERKKDQLQEKVEEETHTKKVAGDGDEGRVEVPVEREGDDGDDDGDDDDIVELDEEGDIVTAEEKKERERLEKVSEEIRLEEEKKKEVEHEKAKVLQQTEEILRRHKEQAEQRKVGSTKESVASIPSTRDTREEERGKEGPDEEEKIERSSQATGKTKMMTEEGKRSLFATAQDLEEEPGEDSEDDIEVDVPVATREGELPVVNSFSNVTSDDSEWFRVFASEAAANFQYLVKRSGMVEENYKRLIKLFRKAIWKCGSYTEIRDASLTAVRLSIVDPSCKAWLEWKEIKADMDQAVNVEPGDGVQEIEVASPDSMIAKLENKTVEEKEEIKQNIAGIYEDLAACHYYAGFAYKKISELAPKVDLETLLTVVKNAAQPMIQLTPADLAQRVRDEVTKGKKDRLAIALRDKGKQVLRECVPSPELIWRHTESMKPTGMLAACVYHYLHITLMPKKVVTQQELSEMFRVPKSTLNRVLSGKRYPGGTEYKRMRRAEARGGETGIESKKSDVKSVRSRTSVPGVSKGKRSEMVEIKEDIRMERRKSKRLLITMEDAEAQSRATTARKEAEREEKELAELTRDLKDPEEVRKTVEKYKAGYVLHE